jgi:HlyD family secretion protein
MNALPFCFSTLALAVVLSPLAGCTQSSVAETSKSPASAAAGAVRVTAGQAQRKTLQRTTEQPARIAAFEEAPLYPKITGYVEEVLVDIGDRVKKDQVLIKLWVPEMKDELRQKEALLVQAKAEIEQAAAAVRAAEAAAKTAEARISEAEAGTTRAEGEYQRWKDQHDRFKKLASSGSVTQNLVDETLNQFRAAEAARQEAAARIESAKAALHQSEANIESAKADEVAAGARLGVAESNLAQAQTMLNYAQIKAPFDGIVTRRNIDTGHYVQSSHGSGSQPLLVVCQADVVRVFVDVPEMEAAMVNIGDTAIIRLQALQGQEVPGQVTRTSWDLEPSNRSLRTEIDIPNQQGALRPGMFATASILLDERKDVLALPVAAVVRQGKDCFCCLVKSGKVHRTPITLGLRSGADVEVLSGLSSNDTVVLIRADSLKDGQPVEVLEQAPAK